MNAKIVTEAIGRRRWPKIPLQCKCVLDVGGGNGDALAYGMLAGKGTVLDIDAKALATGRVTFPCLEFIEGSGECLPFADGSFDAAISRVSLPLMRLPTAVNEIARVLQPGAPVWFAFHGFHFAWDGLLRALKSGNPINIAFRVFVILNGVLLHFTGRTARLGKRCESWQTERAIRRLVVAFDNVRVEEWDPLVVTATRALYAPPHAARVAADLPPKEPRP